jgi:hypothetical protein
MGLDMYLNARQFTARQFAKPELFNKLAQEAPFAVKDFATIELQVAYWRKANHIHAWFVKHVQDGVDNCEEYYVSRDQLQLLLDTCKLVLMQKEEAPNLLPTQEGFFFGSTEYNEYYFSDIQDTIDQLESILKDVPIDWELRYHSSW